MLAAYVKQYVGPAGLIVPSVRFAHELTAMESGAMPLPPITEVGDKASVYANQVWPEAKSELHKRTQAAEQAYADKLAALDRSAPTYKTQKRALDSEYRRKVATGAVATWKRVQAQIEAAEALTPTERYAIYVYTQGAFYKELNPALAGEVKLTTQQRAVGARGHDRVAQAPRVPGAGVPCAAHGFVPPPAAASRRKGRRPPRSSGRSGRRSTTSTSSARSEPQGSPRVHGQTTKAPRTTSSSASRTSRPGDGPCCCRRPRPSRPA